jgi:hypothetical protein
MTLTASQPPAEGRSDGAPSHARVDTDDGTTAGIAAAGAPGPAPAGVPGLQPYAVRAEL